MKLFHQQIYWYIMWLRPKQRIKNLVLFLPLLFEWLFSDVHKVWGLLLFFLLFSVLVGVTYHFNDYKDREIDKLHPIKSLRPLASGKLSIWYIVGISLFLLVAVILYLFVYYDWIVILVTVLYLVNTTIYSPWSKNKVIVDVFSIALWFVIRVFLSYLILWVDASLWLILMVFIWSLWFTFLKRYQEVRLWIYTREIIRSYNVDFLKQVVSIMTSLFLWMYLMYIKQFTSAWFVCITFFLLVLLVLKILYTILFNNNYSDGIEEIIINDKVVHISMIIFVFALIVEYKSLWFNKIHFLY